MSKVLLQFDERVQVPHEEATELHSPSFLVLLHFPQQHHLILILAAQIEMAL